MRCKGNKSEKVLIFLLLNTLVLHSSLVLAEKGLGWWGAGGTGEWCRQGGKWEKKGDYSGRFSACLKLRLKKKLVILKMVVSFLQCIELNQTC